VGNEGQEIRSFRTAASRSNGTLGGREQSREKGEKKAIGGNQLLPDLLITDSKNRLQVQRKKREEKEDERRSRENNSSERPLSAQLARKRPN